MPRQEHDLPTAGRGSLGTAVMLVLILVAGLGIRYALLANGEARPGFAWNDPDGYTRQARALVGEDGRWRWSWDAVHYTWGGRTWVLPPGYPVFLSWFALDRPAFPGNAGHVHPILGTVLAAALFWLGVRLHSRRAGLIAAGIGAFWLPNASGAAEFFQEQLFVPLLTVAFALTVDLWAREARPRLFAAAGAAFALASLTRAMPLYFVPVAALMLVYASAPRSLGLRRAAWFVAGFGALIVPYVAWLSAAHGQLILIDNHGSIEMDVRSSIRSQATPGVVDTIRLLAAQIAADPGTFVIQKFDLLRALFHVQGGRWLQLYGATSTPFLAVVWKVIAHVGVDLAFVGTALLAPFGVVLARRSREAVLVALWIPVVVVLSLAASYAGARYRAPFEPHIIALASVALAGSWRHATRWQFAAALSCTLLVAFLVVPQIGRSLRSWPDYGTGQKETGQAGTRFTARGPVGFNVPALPEVTSIALVLADGSATDAFAANVKVNGRPAAELMISSTPRTVTLARKGVGMLYVEIQPRLPAGQPSPPYIVTTSR
jgi:hypothetical protein